MQLPLETKIKRRKTSFQCSQYPVAFNGDHLKLAKTVDKDGIQELFKVMVITPKLVISKCQTVTLLGTEIKDS